MAGHGGGGSVPKHLIGPQVKRRWNVFAGLFASLAIICALWLAQLSFQIAAGAEDPQTLWDHHPKDLKDLYLRSDQLQYWFLAFSAIAASLYWYPRRRHGSRAGLYLAIGLALGVLWIAILTYAPCAPEGNPVVPVVGWAIGIFEGDIEIAGPGAKCALAFSPGFELARGLAVLLALWAVTFVVRVVARRRIEFWRTTASSDIDVVVGLDSTTLPLIKALAAERDARAEPHSSLVQRPPFRLKNPRDRAAADTLKRHGPIGEGRWSYLRWRYTGLRTGDLRRRRQPMTTVAVIDREGSDHYGEELRKLSVKVLAADPDSEEMMRLLIINDRILSRPSLALRRLYIATPDQQLNLRIYAKAREVLDDAIDARPHVHNVVPRVVVRLDDEREARQWRLEQLQGGERRYFADAITPEGIAATQVAEEIIPPEEWLPTDASVERVLLVGESPLAAVMLDELAWQLWTRYEVALARYRQPQADPEQARRELEAAARPGLRRVSLLGPNAQLRAQEWNATRAPWRIPHQEEDIPALRLFDVDDPADYGASWSQYQSGWEPLADEALRSSERAVVLMVEDSGAYRAAATRLSLARLADAPSQLGRGTVFLRVAGSATNREPVTSGGMIRFSPALAVFDGRAEASEDREIPLPPPGWVVRLARQQHMVFARAWTEGSTSGPREVGPKLTIGAWEDLPWFFRDDNVQQQWTVLNAFGEWQRVTPETAEELPPQDVGEIAAAEGRRWRELRRRTGWWQVGRGQRWDRLRLTEQNLDDAEASVSEYDINAVRQILNRLWAMGYTPRVGWEPRRESGSAAVIAEPG